MANPTTTTTTTKRPPGETRYFRCVVMSREEGQPNKEEYTHAEGCVYVRSISMAWTAREVFNHVVQGLVEKKERVKDLELEQVGLVFGTSNLNDMQSREASKSAITVEDYKDENLLDEILYAMMYPGVGGLRFHVVHKTPTEETLIDFADAFQAQTHTHSQKRSKQSN